MFTGLVREVGTVVSFDDGRLRVESSLVAAVGDSVSIAGVCLTVVDGDRKTLAFDAVPETLARTTLGRLAPGSSVNLEPALRAGEALGGHYVQGHVDGVSLTVAEIDDEGFAAALVPHTLAVTTLGSLVPGDEVNLEADVLAKYVERLAGLRSLHGDNG